MLPSGPVTLVMGERGFRASTTATVSLSALGRYDRENMTSPKCCLCSHTHIFIIIIIIISYITCSTDSVYFEQLGRIYAAIIIYYLL